MPPRDTPPKPDDPAPFAVCPRCGEADVVALKDAYAPFLMRADGTLGGQLETRVMDALQAYECRACNGDFTVEELSAANGGAEFPSLD